MTPDLSLIREVQRLTTGATVHHTNGLIALYVSSALENRPEADRCKGELEAVARGLRALRVSQFQHQEV